MYFSLCDLSGSLRIELGVVIVAVVASKV